MGYGAVVATVVDHPDAKWSTRDLLALELLQPLLCDRVWPMTSWSLAPAAIIDVANDILVHHRRLVLELGTGFSTLMLAGVVAQARHDVRLVAIEHDEMYADDLRHELRQRGIEARADVVTAKLTPKGRARQWYSRRSVRSALAGARPDVLIIDGPPGSSARGARHPALELLPVLDPRATVLVDDVNRPEERADLDEWAAALPSHRFAIVDESYAIGRPHDMWNTAV
jgi:predicted O-methyltransferase YrrM